MKIQHNAHEVADAFKRLPESVLKEVDGALGNGAARIVREARERVPRVTSELTKTIKNTRVSLLEHHITAEKEYASFVEEGTDGTTKSGKRKKGQVGTLTSAIRAWVKKRNIIPRTEGMSQDSLAAVIARKIAREGTEPHPFMQPAFDAVAPTLDARIRASVARGIAAVEPGRAL